MGRDRSTSRLYFADARRSGYPAAQAFGGETIMNALKVHSQMAANGTVVGNSFPLGPEEGLDIRGKSAP